MVELGNLVISNDILKDLEENKCDHIVLQWKDI